MIALSNGFDDWGLSIGMREHAAGSVVVGFGSAPLKIRRRIQGSRAEARERKSEAEMKVRLSLWSEKVGFLFRDAYKGLEPLQINDARLLLGPGLIISAVGTNWFMGWNAELKNKNLIPYKKLAEPESMKLWL